MYFSLFSLISSLLSAVSWWLFQIKVKREKIKVEESPCGDGFFVAGFALLAAFAAFFIFPANLLTKIYSYANISTTPANLYAKERIPMDFLESYYNSYNEDSRLLSQHGQVEYITTQKYIHECLAGTRDSSILEIGAGTGRYSVALAKEGYAVTAVELIEHNIDMLKSKLDGSENITVLQGNAVDLSFLGDNTFDLTLLLGPMYHLYTKEEKLLALSEAVRVTKPKGYILVAYCMNEPTVIQYVFARDNLKKVFDSNMLTDDWHCISEPSEIFELIRTEEIAELDSAVPVDRIKLVASDGATNYMRELVDSMDIKTFEKWVEYHLSTCERQDLIGASHHTIDILRKKI